MSRHITFDEMVDLIYSENLDAQSNNLAAKINSHIMNCEDCYEQYSVLLTLREQTEAIAVNEFLNSSEQLAVLKALKEFQIKNEAVGEQINTFMEKLCSFTTSITMQIKNYSELVVRKAVKMGDSFAFDFSWAIPVGARGTGAQQVNRALVIDDENELNRIKLQGDSIILQLDPQGYGQNPTVYLLTEDNNVVAKQLTREGDVLTVCFSNVPLGELKLFIE